MTEIGIIQDVFITQPQFPMDPIIDEIDDTDDEDHDAIDEDMNNSDYLSNLFDVDLDVFTDIEYEIMYSFRIEILSYDDLLVENVIRRKEALLSQLKEAIAKNHQLMLTFCHFPFALEALADSQTRLQNQYNVLHEL